MTALRDEPCRKWTFVIDDVFIFRTLGGGEASPPIGANIVSKRAGLACQFDGRADLEWLLAGHARALGAASITVAEVVDYYLPPAPQ